MSKKREAIISGIEQMDAEQRKIQAERKREELNDKKEKARPPLLKRVGIGLVDLVIAAAMAFGFFMIAYTAVFPRVGYNTSAQYVLDSYDNSHLFVYGSTGYEKLSSHYDDSKTPEENYNVPISHYYKTNARAIEDNRYSAYTAGLVETGYYELNSSNDVVRKEGIPSSTVKPVLQERYENAVKYFYTDPALKQAQKTLRGGRACRQCGAALCHDDDRWG